MATIKTGLEVLLTQKPEWINSKRLGLLANPASIASSLKNAVELINYKFPNQLKAIFSPQHGYYASKQDNMIESNNFIDPILKLPVYSLYSKVRQPTKEMFENIDILLIDLQDVGTRVYTFIYTVSYCMEACKLYNKKVVVLDRPNPIGGETVEGNCVEEEFTSFVGRYSIPMRHGLTIGELSYLFNDHFGIKSDLEVIPMQNWTRNMYFNDTGLTWITPSPNLPTPDSAIVYPGQVLWEGTNISEGRGTTKPFEIFGAPFLDTQKILEFLGPMPDVILRATCFEPTFNKWQGHLCRGFQIHVTDLKNFKPYKTSLKILHAILHIHPDKFTWKSPPYEYEFEKMPIDLILGSQKLRKSLEKNKVISNNLFDWQIDEKKFIELSKKYLLYR